MAEGYICHVIAHSTITTQNCQSVHAPLTRNVLEEYAATRKTSYMPPLLALFSQCNRRRISCPSSCSLLLKGLLPRNLCIIYRMMDEHVSPPLRLSVFIKQMLSSLHKLRLKSFNGIQSFYTKYLLMLYINNNYWQHPKSVGSETIAMIKHFITNKLVTWITHTIYNTYSYPYACLDQDL